MTRLTLKPMFIVAGFATALTACHKEPALSLRTAVTIDPDRVPVILAGQLLDEREAGPWHSDAEVPRLQMQLRKVHVRVENVLRGDVRGNVVTIYYFQTNSSGPRHMGMLGFGGDWHRGERILWFLMRESGVLRTIEDTWARTAVPVYSGSHTSYKPRPNEPYRDQVIDVLLDEGAGCDLKELGMDCDFQQWGLAVLASSGRAIYFDPDYTIAKLRAIARNYPGEAGEAALGELESLSCADPQHRDAAAGLCFWR